MYLLIYCYLLIYEKKVVNDFLNWKKFYFYRFQILWFFEKKTKCMYLVFFLQKTIKAKNKQIRRKVALLII